MSRGRVYRLSSLFAVFAVVPAVSPGRCDAQPGIRSVLRVIPGPSSLDRFSRPLALTADSTRGIFLVADTGGHRIAIFDGAGRCRGAVACGTDASGKTPVEPRSVALDRRGRLYVVDELSHDLEVMTSNGTHLGYIRPAVPPEIAATARPQHVAVGASGRIYVLYGGQAPGLAILDPAGKPVGSLGFAASESGGFKGPVSVAVNADETEICIVDPIADQAVQIYGSDGTRLAAFGGHGEGDGTFSLAMHAAWGPDNTLWVTDTVRHTISIFDSRGKFLNRIGGFGGGPGEFDYPVACAFLAQDRLVVLERAGARCQVFAVVAGGSRVSQPGESSGGSGASGTDFASVEVR